MKFYLHKYEYRTKKKKENTFIFRSYPNLFCTSKIKGDLKKLKDYFVSDNYLFIKKIQQT